MDKISIVVPCYNVEKYVGKCIESIKNQTYKNLEVIMIDDGSRDNTKKVIKDLISDDERFSYHYKENGGLSSGRNKGISLATGKYICFIDSDDWIDEEYIEKLYNSIIENKTDISVCGIKRVYDKKTTYNKMNEMIIKLSMKPAAWNKMYLTSLFKENKIQFPVGLWYEDLGTTTKFTLLNNFSVVDDCLYNYRQNNNSIMHTYDDRIFQIYEIVEEIEKYAKKKKIYDSEKSILEFINVYHILIGTTYRASFHKNFNVNMLKEICNYVEKKYKNCYKNIYIKDNFGFIYKVYLYFLKKKQYKIVYILLKMFNRFMYL